MRNILSTQIFRVDAKNSFMEVINSAYGIGKVQLNFAQYNEQTHKQTSLLEYYFDFATALYISNLILSGKLDRTIALAEKEGKFNGRPINDFTSYYSDMSGIDCEGSNSYKYEKNHARFPWLEKGKSISRQFKIQKSAKYKYMFRIEYGLGMREGTGIIKPDGNPKTFINIPITEKDAIAFALTIQQDLLAYKTQFYMTFSNKLFTNQTCNVYEKNSAEAEPNYSEPKAAEATDEVKEVEQSSTQKIRNISLRTIGNEFVEKGRFKVISVVDRNTGVSGNLFFDEKGINTLGEKWNSFSNMVKEKNFNVNIVAEINGNNYLFVDMQ